MSRSQFPPAEPASLTDAKAIAENDWKAFSGLQMMVDHWARPAWPDGAKAVYWLLSLGGYPHLRASAQSCADALSHVPDLDVVPLDLLHLTLCRVGDAAELSVGAIAAVASSARKRTSQLAPFGVSIGPLAGSAGAIRFTVTPWDRLFLLHGELVAARNSVVGGPEGSGFRPHVSVAYNARRRDAEPIIRYVRALHRNPPVNLTVTRIDLVELRREGRVYGWQLLDQVQLSG